MNTNRKYTELERLSTGMKYQALVELLGEEEAAKVARRSLARKSRGHGRLRYKQAGGDLGRVLSLLEEAVAILRELQGEADEPEAMDGGEGMPVGQGKSYGGAFGWLDDYLAGRVRSKSRRQATAEMSRMAGWLDSFVGAGAEPTATKSGGMGRYLGDPYAGSPFERGEE